MRIGWQIYIEYVNTLLGNMYAHAPQGRVGGIKNLQTEEAEGMLASGFGLSSCFKTASVFGFQPVIIPDIVKEMFEYYFRVIRKIILKMNNLLENEYVFINYRGEKYCSLDKNISAWFRKHSFNVTTTTLRSLSDTQTHELLQHGRISSAFEESMMEINGHSSQMSKDHYRRNSLKAHVQNGNAIFDIIRTEPMPENSIFAGTSSTTVRLNYGIEHNQYGKEGKRIKWSAAEINYLVALFNRQDIKNSSRPYILCLEIIKQDPYAQRIFHPHHVSSHQRLRIGHQMYQRANNKITSRGCEKFI